MSMKINMVHQVIPIVHVTFHLLDATIWIKSVFQHRGGNFWETAEDRGRGNYAIFSKISFFYYCTGTGLVHSKNYLMSLSLTCSGV